MKKPTIMSKKSCQRLKWNCLLNKRRKILDGLSKNDFKNVKGMVFGVKTSLYGLSFLFDFLFGEVVILVKT